MQSDEELVVLRLQSPDAVQHWAAILVPSGACASVGEVMHMPRVGWSDVPHKASTSLNGDCGGGGEGEGRTHCPPRVDIRTPHRAHLRAQQPEKPNWLYTGASKPSVTARARSPS